MGGKNNRYFVENSNELASKSDYKQQTHSSFFFAFRENIPLPNRSAAVTAALCTAAFLLAGGKFSPVAQFPTSPNRLNVAADGN